MLFSVTLYEVTEQNGKNDSLVEKVLEAIKHMAQRFSLFRNMPKVLHGTWYKVPFPYESYGLNTTVAVGKVRCAAVTQTAQRRFTVMETWKKCVSSARDGNADPIVWKDVLCRINLLIHILGCIRVL